MVSPSSANWFAGWSYLEDGGSIALRNVGTLQYHYTSQPGTPRLESSSSWTLQISLSNGFSYRNPVLYMRNQDDGWSPRNFSLYHRVRTDSAFYPASYPMGTRGSFPGDKVIDAWKLTTHLHLVPRSRMRGAIHPRPQYASMAWCSVKRKHRDNPTFTFTTKNNFREAGYPTKCDVSGKK